MYACPESLQKLTTAIYAMDSEDKSCFNNFS